MRKGVRLVSAKGVVGALGAIATTVALAAVMAFTVGNPLTPASAAPKPPAPPAPTITSGPSGSVTTTSATFTFTDSQSGVVFQCSLDNGAYASCTSPRSYTNLAEVAHTFRVRATFGTSNPSAAATRTWTVLDTTPPPKPTISGGAEASDKSKAKFTLSDLESGVTFVCSLGDSFTTPAYSACSKNVQYSGLGSDEYCLRAKAKDAAGNLSEFAELCWSNFEKKAFGISGTLTQSLYPGKSQFLDLVLSNPNNQAIEILSVTITIAAATKTNAGADNPDCDGTTNLLVTKGLTGTVIVPANSTKSLSELVPESQWPVLHMPDLSTNQDGCKNTTFTINYSGTAAKA